MTRQQAGSGAGQNRSNYDMSGLFDKELQRQQQTNYETRSTTEQRQDSNQSALDKIRDLARRQDELLKRQAELARTRESLDEEALKRELEKLTREQSELRQQAEDLARQMASRQNSQSGEQSQQNARNGQRGQQSQSGQQGQAGQQSQSGQQGASGGGSQRMRDALEQMRSAAGGLRRQDPAQASDAARRALDALRDLERQMQSAGPDEERRALGELQLEARQLADSQRQIASELEKSGQGDGAKDSARRLAGDQERLAERARRLQNGLKQQSAAPSTTAGARASGRGGDSDNANGKAAAGQAARDMDQQRLTDRMQQAADAMRSAADRGRGTQRGSTAPGAESGEMRQQAAAQQTLARELDRVADKLAAARGGADNESRKLSEQLGHVQEQREKLNAASRDLARLGQQSGASGSPQAASPQKSPGQGGKPGEGQQGGGGGTGTDLARLRDEYTRRLQETSDLLTRLQREDQTFARGGNAGFTFEGRGMTMSAPGTEAFKQDFAKWEDLKRQATQALDLAESTLSKKLEAKQAHDRLAAGADDNAPPAYRKQVDSYFKAIAGKQK